MARKLAGVTRLSASGREVTLDATPYLAEILKQPLVVEVVTPALRGRPVCTLLRNLLDHAQLTKDEFEIRLLVCRCSCGAKRGKQKCRSDEQWRCKLS
jgi:hypothetical protein